MAKRKQSTAELIGISNFSRNGLQTKSQGEIVYFLVQPTNISVRKLRESCEEQVKRINGTIRLDDAVRWQNS